MNIPPILTNAIGAHFPGMISREDYLEYHESPWELAQVTDEETDGDWEEEEEEYGSY